MGAFIFAAIIAGGTLLITVLMIMANGMSDAPSVQGSPVAPTFFGGMIIAGIVLASHWMPHIGW